MTTIDLQNAADSPFSFLAMSLPEWMDRGACSSTLDPDDWFPYVSTGRPPKDSTKVPARIRAPKEICGGCPVVDECLAYALERNEPYGIWGGLTESERRRLRREVS